MNDFPKKVFFFSCAVFFCLVFTMFTFKYAKAQDVLDKLQGNMTKTGESAGFAEPKEGKDLESIISNIVKVILSFIGAVFLVLVIWGGNLWLMAGGNDEEITKAKSYIKNGVIGMAIILAAYLVTNMVVGLLVQLSGV